MLFQALCGPALEGGGQVIGMGFSLEGAQGAEPVKISLADAKVFLVHSGAEVLGTLCGVAELRGGIGEEPVHLCLFRVGGTAYAEIARIREGERVVNDSSAKIAGLAMPFGASN